MKSKIDKKITKVATAMIVTGFCIQAATLVWLLFPYFRRKKNK